MHREIAVVAGVVLSAALSGSALAAYPSTTIPLSPRASFLSPSAGLPLVIPIADHGIKPGHRLFIEQVGDYSYIGIPGEGIVVGVFSSLPGVAGAIDAGPDYNTSFAGGADIAQDFRISFLLQRGNPLANQNGITI